MDFPAAPRPGRRVSFGAAAVLAGFLLLAPLFVLAPFVLLTLVSRPRTLRELFWLVAAGAALGLTLQGPGGVAADLLRVSGLVLSLVFVVSSLRPRTGLFGRALLAVLLTAAIVVGWEWARGISWPVVHQAFTTMLREGYQAMAGSASGAATPPKPEAQNLLQSLIDAAPQLARGLPGLLALEGLAGVALAWSWHHRLAAQPLGPTPAPFRLFRFTDHLVWGAIFTLALLVAPLPDEVAVIAENLLILWVGLYSLRGLAVMAALLAGTPVPLRVLAAGLAVLLSPLALGGCLALGLADNWIDLRGRLRPPAPGGA
jgi:hypothetical protein